MIDKLAAKLTPHQSTCNPLAVSEWQLLQKLRTELNNSTHQK